MFIVIWAGRANKLTTWHHYILDHHHSLERTPPYWKRRNKNWTPFIFKHNLRIKTKEDNTKRIQFVFKYVSKFVLQLWKILNPFTEHKNTNDPVLYYKFILVHLWMSVWVQKKNSRKKFFCVLSNQNKTFLLIMTCLSVILTAWLRNLSGKLIIIIHIHTQVANSWEREEERNNLTTYWILELEKCK